MQKKGVADFGDRWAYFARAIGVSGLVITADGSIVSGKRIGDVHEGELSLVSGYLNFRDGRDYARDDVVADLHEELAEEVGIMREDVRGILFLGIFGNGITGEVDITYAVKTNKSSDYFLSGKWKKRATGKIEHGGIILLPDLKEVQSVLNCGRTRNSDERCKLFYSARGALENLQESDL